MQELDKSWGRVTRVWWLIIWRAVLGGFVLGGIAGFVIGFIMGASGVALETITLTTSIAGLFVSLGWGLVVVRMALRKTYGDFRIALVPRDAQFRSEPTL